MVKGGRSGPAGLEVGGKTKEPVVRCQWSVARIVQAVQSFRSAELVQIEIQESETSNDCLYNEFWLLNSLLFPQFAIRNSKLFPYALC